ncbi:MAG: aldose epimerase family protein [Enterococcus sp.]
MKIIEEDFGNGFHLITLTNQSGMKLAVSDLGARIVHLQVPVKDGMRELVLGFDSAEEYQTKDAYIGASIGRVAGRIRDGKFKIGQESYQVEVDPETGHTLHGGTPGFEEKKWTYTCISGANETSVIFSMTSPDGEHGFPGNLDVEVRYTLTNDNVWRIQTRGLSDKDTLFNPTNHVYFNLTGDVTQTVGEHTLWVNAKQYAPLRKDSIPTGELVAVADSAFDFTKPRKLQEMFDDTSFKQKQLVDGIDHPFFLRESGLETSAAKLISPDELVSVTVETTEPSVVIFTANFGENTPEMHGEKLANHGGITFETQEAPGSEQFESFGNILLSANEIMETTTEFKIETFA